MRPLRVEAQSATSRRYAIVSEDGDSVWLYLTVPDDLAVERDCWLFNTTSAVPTRSHASYSAWALPPPAPPELLAPGAVRDPSSIREWLFFWSELGDQVAVLADGEGLGIVSLHHERGFARLITDSSAWASLWDAELFDSLVTGAA